MNQECRNKLFHISRRSDWRIGEKIVSGDHINEFWKRCRNYSPQIIMDDGREVSYWDVMRNINSLRFETHQALEKFLYEQLEKITKKYAFYVREQTFDDVRKESFHQLPSRKTCLWLTDKEHLPFWLSQFEDNSLRSLLELDLCGEIFCADQSWLAADTFSSYEYEERAKHYWNGEMCDSPKLEYLFCGKATIKDITVFKCNSEILNQMNSSPLVS